MADKKDAPKGAKGGKDAKAPAPSNFLMEVVGWIFFLMLVVAMIATFIGQENLFPTLRENVDLNDPSTVNVDAVIPAGDIQLGEYVVTKKEVSVRREVGGAVIGKQSKRTLGRVIQGPTVAYNEVWWNIDYEEAPDGWISEKDLTTKIWTYRFFHSFSIFYDWWKVVAIWITVICVVLLFIVKMKTKAVEAIVENRQKVISQEARLNAFSLPNVEPIVHGLPILPSGDPVSGNVEPISTGKPTAQNILFSQSADHAEATSTKRWEHIEELMTRTSENDWRQAIIEADILLDEMLAQMGYSGDSIGDRLKRAEESNFANLNQAWEAHKVRNTIAHSGSQFVLTRDEARRVIAMYKRVFDEFYYV